MKRTAGVTLLELLVAAAIVGMITAATTRALSVGFKSNQTIASSRAREESRMQFEDSVTELIRQAWLANAVTETGCYFVGQVGAMTPGDASQIVSAGGATGASPTSSSASSGSSSGAAQSDNPLTASGNSDDLTFTAVGSRPPTQLFESTDDWEANNTSFGPQGGVAEICLSLVGQSDPSGHTGLFVRTQRPADNDPTQGGYQRVLNPDVSSVGYEFYDGTNWNPTWDTRTMTPRRLPAAVRVTYRFKSDTRDHVFVVAVPYSDVTAANPVTQ